MAASTGGTARNVSLAVIYHDPQGVLCGQMKRVLPVLMDIFGGLAVRASHMAPVKSLALFEAAGARTGREPPQQPGEGSKIGRARRGALALALQLDCPHIMSCDCDAVLHWAERYPDELAQIAARISEHDFTVLGRTRRAFDSLPRSQRDTEAIVNHVFATISGLAWHVTASGRGLSRRAAAAILAGCPNEEISTDVSWPLYLKQAGGFSLGYLTADGLEFEMGDKCQDEIAAAGGYARWMERLDADPRRWARRLNLARLEVEAMIG